MADVQERALRRFTVHEYHRMGDAGVLDEQDRVELIRGEVVEMTPIGPKHANCVRRLIAALSRLVGARAIVDAQNPIVLGERSELQPDLVLLKPCDDFYAAHPRPSDTLLVIEVSDSSLEFDRRVKAPLYAAAGVPELWIVDLQQSTIDIYRNPGGGGYDQRETATRRERVRVPIADAALTLGVDEIL
jgi:Uma2 family endonuclease